MLNTEEIESDGLLALRAEFLKEDKARLKMNLSLLEMLKGNTQPQDIAALREVWVEPLQHLIEELQSSRCSNAD